jgi:hypothetical protein
VELTRRRWAVLDRNPSRSHTLLPPPVDQVGIGDQDGQHRHGVGAVLAQELEGRRVAVLDQHLPRRTPDRAGVGSGRRPAGRGLRTGALDRVQERCGPW